MLTWTSRLPIPMLTLLLGLSASQVLADEASDRAAIDAAARAWIAAFNAHDANALIAMTTEDIVLLDPGIDPVSGREAARRILRQAAMGAAGRLETETREIAIAGDLAWRIGTLEHQLANGGPTIRSPSLEVWKRVRGDWKIHRHMSASVLTQPDLLRKPPLPVRPMRDRLPPRE